MSELLAKLSSYVSIAAARAAAIPRMSDGKYRRLVAWVVYEALEIESPILPAKPEGLADAVAQAPAVIERLKALSVPWKEQFTNIATQSTPNAIDGDALYKMRLAVYEARLNEKNASSLLADALFHSAFCGDAVALARTVISHTDERTPLSPFDETIKALSDATGTTCFAFCGAFSMEAAGYVSNRMAESAPSKELATEYYQEAALVFARAARVYPNPRLAKYVAQNWLEVAKLIGNRSIDRISREIFLDNYAVVHLYRVDAYGPGLCEKLGRPIHVKADFAKAWEQLPAYWKDPAGADGLIRQLQQRVGFKQSLSVDLLAAALIGRQCIRMPRAHATPRGTAPVLAGQSKPGESWRDASVIWPNDPMFALFLFMLEFLTCEPEPNNDPSLAAGWEPMSAESRAALAVRVTECERLVASSTARTERAPIKWRDRLLGWTGVPEVRAANAAAGWRLPEVSRLILEPAVIALRKEVGRGSLITAEAVIRTLSVVPQKEQ